ncbi:hypothetical protein QZN17_05060 [Burkholderia multivorans]|nr:hypothetical protein [Burkholderia multivorans]
MSESSADDDDDGGYCWLCDGFGPQDGGYCEWCGEGNEPRDDGS